MYNFDELGNRKNSYSCKYDCLESEIPMWIADMDYAIAPSIAKAIKKRANINTYGYTDLPDSYFKSYISWWNRRYNFKMKKEWMMFSTGVVSSISSIVRRITKPGEKIIVMSPVYNIFYNSIVNNGRFINSCDLTYDNNGHFELDFNELEKRMKDPLSSMLILCNPHNPIGRIWSKEELERIKELSNKYNVYVISDEIHCDIKTPGLKYTPYLSVKGSNKYAIMLMSATKCFSIPALMSSAIYIEDDYLRFEVYRGINNDEVAEPSAFAIDPVIAAFNKEEKWVDEMNEYVYQNKQLFYKKIEENTKLKIVKGDATYLVLVDTSYYDLDGSRFVDRLRKDTGIIVSKGEVYGANSKHFFRINLATTKEIVSKVIDLIISFCNNY